MWQVCGGGRSDISGDGGEVQDEGHSSQTLRVTSSVERKIINYMMEINDSSNEMLGRGRNSRRRQLLVDTTLISACII